MEALGPIPDIFNALIVHPLINVLMGVYTALNSVGVPYALGFSIIGLTIIIRILLYPIISKQLHTSKKMQGLSPHLKNIKSKHKGDSKRIQQETMSLYKEHGVNPMAGCLPALVQIPIFFGLYNLIRNITERTPEEVVVYINDIVIEPFELTAPWDPTFFGIPLAATPREMLVYLPIIAIAIPILTGLFQFIQSKMMFYTPPSTGKELAEKGSSGIADDFSTVFQKQAAYIFPVMIGFFSFTFAFALSLYWNTFSIFGIIQQYKIAGLGGLEPIWQKVRKR